MSSRRLKKSLYVPIKSSDMTLPVNIEQISNTKNTSGGVKKGWALLYQDIFVDLTTKMVSSFSPGGELVTATTHTIRTRYFDGVEPGMRVDNYTYGRKYHIVSAEDPFGTGEELRIVATELVGADQ